ncbi:hypothetical protein HK102_013852, partial [Quaeritorhiza haematococci]
MLGGDTKNTQTPAPTEKKLRKFTSDELRKHNKDGDAYVAIRNQVYDVSEWMNRHPGGKEVLLVAAGRDATQ